MSRLLRSSNPDGPAANDLLREFFRGYPATELRRLLTSSNEIAVASGAFIASELGGSAAVVQEDLVQIAKHAQPTVRCDVIGAIGGMKELAIPSAIAIALGGIADEDESVRWKAVRLLGFVDDSLLRLAEVHIPDLELKSAISWLLAPRDEGTIAEILGRFGEPSRLKRLTALVAAVRIRSHTLEPLRFASSSQDEEVRVMANEYLDEFRSVTGRHR